MNVPLLDLTAQYESIRPELDAAVARVVGSQRFILGPEVEACERAVARYCGCAHGVGVSSGTDALLVALMAEGIGPGDEVITTACSFFATAGSIARLGARPVFADIDPSTGNIDPELVEDRVTEHTRAVLPVHLFGRLADMDPLIDIARRRGLVVVEDAAQAIGAERGGRRAGSIGDCGCLSFFPSKNLGAFGDGGMVVTNDPARAGRLQVLRAHGAGPGGRHAEVGGNFRLDALQAAVLLAKLPHLDDWTARRRANARRYDALFRDAGLSGDGPVRLPGDDPEGRHVFNQYVIRVPRRDELRTFLAARSVGSAAYYPRPLHLLECFARLGYREGDLPESERWSREALALPVFPELTDAQAEHVVRATRDFFAGRAA